MHVTSPSFIVGFLTDNLASLTHQYFKTKKKLKMEFQEDLTLKLMFTDTWLFFNKSSKHLERTIPKVSTCINSVTDTCQKHVFNHFVFRKYPLFRYFFNLNLCRSYNKNHPMLTLSLPRVPKIKIQGESQISFVKY